MGKDGKEKLGGAGQRFILGRVRRRPPGVPFRSPSGMRLGDDVGDGPGHDMNGLGQPDLGALVPHSGSLGIGGGLRAALLPGVGAPGPQVHGAALDAMARATTARVRGSSGAVPSRRPAASIKDRATARRRSWMARSTSGLSRTISGNDRSQPALGLDGLSTGGEQGPQVLQEGSGAVDEGFEGLRLGSLGGEDEEVGFGGEVVEDGAPGDAGEGGDVVDRHGRVAAFLGQGECGGADGGRGCVVPEWRAGRFRSRDHLTLSVELHSMQVGARFLTKAPSHAAHRPHRRLRTGRQRCTSKPSMTPYDLRCHNIGCHLTIDILIQ